MSSNATCLASAGAAAQLFSSTLQLLAAAQCIMPDKKSPYDAVPDQETFDFIVVGAGSAGSVVASRLSEINGWNVLLLEAGFEPPIESSIPKLHGALVGSTFDWGFEAQLGSLKQQALKNGVLPWPRGKMLGGSSSINGMMYVRGRDADYLPWHAENPNWSVQNVHYYFNKAENFQDMTLNNDPHIYKSYGHEGPLAVNSFNNTFRPITQRLLDSWDHIGVRKVLDINSANYHGHGVSGYSRVTARNGERESTYKAYLKKAESRSNLKIVTNAMVTKILINEEAKAYGVEVEINGNQKRFLVNLEVIISAGVIKTPQLLMLSGIGPKEHLLSKNITSVVDLPGVGKNLQDHTLVFIPVYGDTDLLGDENTPELMFEYAKYLYNKTGYYASAFITDLIAFFSSRENMTYPEFQSHHILFWKKSTVIRQLFEVFKDEVIDSLTQDNLDNGLHLFALNLLHPYSRGEISLNSKNPQDPPIIKPNYYGDERDIDTTVKGIHILTKLLNTPYFTSIKAFIPKANLPQCNEYEFLSNLYWKCYATHMTSTVFHPVGTSKMGPNPKDAVVDTMLKVHGVKGLRVIDASIMPTLTSGNTNAPTIMIGETGSDMIKREYNMNTK